MGKSKVIVIGGGASGIVAAIFAARDGAKVTILEQKDKIGRKILATGNGRCNLSNKDIAIHHYYSVREDQTFLNKILCEFDVKETLNFFNRLGIDIVEKEEGRLYPRSDQASSVVSVLLLELHRLKVDIRCEEHVQSIELGDSIRVITDNNKYYCNKLILAAGGKSSPNLGSNGSGYELAKLFGHTIKQTFPSLVQLKTDYLYLKQLKGTKVVGAVSLLNDQNELIKEDRGEILFTDYGISGPPVLQISRDASYYYENHLDTYVLIDLIPEQSIEQLDNLLINRFAIMPTKSAESSLIGFINNRLIMPILKSSEITPAKKAGDITKEERKRMVYCLKNISMKVTGTQDWNNSQVTAGGIKLSEVDMNSLASKKAKGVYLCGEILDVDGICGGYNLQWAWSSGAIAGKNAALEEQK